MKDYYKILGIGQDASEDEIKKAYQTLVKEYHPDKYVDNPLQSLAEEKMKEINEAYEALINKDKKAGYDKAGYRERDANDFEIFTLFRKANDLLERRLFESARKEFEKILSINPHLIAAHLGTGISYLQQEKFQEAISSFEKVINLNPHIHEAYNYTGICHLRLQNFVKSREYFTKASELAPEEPLYLENIAHSYLQENNTKEAMSYFNKVLKLVPDNAGVHISICRICIEQGFYENAEIHFNKAKELDPGHPTIVELERIGIREQFENLKHKEKQKEIRNKVSSNISNISGSVSEEIKKASPGESGKIVSGCMGCIIYIIIFYFMCMFMSLCGSCGQ